MVARRTASHPSRPTSVATSVHTMDDGKGIWSTPTVPRIRGSGGNSFNAGHSQPHSARDLRADFSKQDQVLTRAREPTCVHARLCDYDPVSVKSRANKPLKKRLSTTSTGIS